MELQLIGPSAEIAAKNGVNGYLRLAREEDGQTFNVPVRWRNGQDKCLLSTVPVGAYTWGVSIESGWIRVPETGMQSGVEIVANEIALLDVPLPKLGYLSIEAVGPKGLVVCNVQLADGPIFTGRGKSTWVRSLMCYESPQLIGPLLPGALIYAPLNPLRRR
jgi:hypothetical protein